MLTLARKLLLTGFLTVVGTAGLASKALAQQPPEGVEVLARGPVHEAFAATSEQPKPTPVLNRRPPEPVEELPPDQKPDGDNVLWIPGYWHYDDDRSDFIWISGFWRASPPGRMWVPGSWREVAGGHQWVQGFWQDVTPSAGKGVQEPMIEYLPQPPQPLEIRPEYPGPERDRAFTFPVRGSGVAATSGGRASGLAIVRAGCGRRRSTGGLPPGSFSWTVTGITPSPARGTLVRPRRRSVPASSALPSSSRRPSS